MKKIIWKIRYAIGKLFLKLIKVDDPWKIYKHKIPLRLFGLGAIHDFSWYLDGESTVEVEKIDDIIEWLNKCEYKSDFDLFHEKDFWQHPKTFEQIRKGDCEDHALWAWRKLGEIGINAQFVCGYCINNGKIDYKRRHAWVIYTTDGEEYLLETVAKDKNKSIFPLNNVKDKYLPEFAVNNSCQHFIYLGFIKAQKENPNIKNTKIS